jgi:hypothetical protein
MSSSHEVTHLLRDWANGDQSALEALTPLVYAELRRLAGSYLQRERPGHTLQPTALVHEAYLRLVEQGPSNWENRSAITESAAAKAVTDFIQNDVLAQASAAVQAGPNAKPDPDLKVRTALDRASTHIAGKFKDQPLVEASIRQTIGKTYKDLGLYPDAQRQLESALDLRRRFPGERHPDTLETMGNLAMLYEGEGKYANRE